MFYRRVRGRGHDGKPSGKLTLNNCIYGSYRARIESTSEANSEYTGCADPSCSDRHGCQPESSFRYYRSVSILWSCSHHTFHSNQSTGPSRARHHARISLWQPCRSGCNACRLESCTHSRCVCPIWSLSNYTNPSNHRLRHPRAGHSVCALC